MIGNNVNISSLHSIETVIVCIRLVKKFSLDCSGNIKSEFLWTQCVYCKYFHIKHIKLKAINFISL